MQIARINPLHLSHVTPPLCDPAVVPADLTYATLSAWCDNPAALIKRGPRRGQSRFYLAVETAKQWFMLVRHDDRSIGLYRCPQKVRQKFAKPQLISLSTPDGIVIAYAAYSGLTSIAQRTTLTQPLPGDPAYAADLLFRGLLPRALGDGFKVLVNTFRISKLKRGTIMPHRDPQCRSNHLVACMGVVPVSAFNGTSEPSDTLTVEMFPFPGFPKNPRSTHPALDDVAIGIMLRPVAPHVVPVQHGTPLPDDEGVGSYRPPLPVVRKLRHALRNSDGIEGWMPIPIMLPILFDAAWERRHEVRFQGQHVRHARRVGLKHDPTSVLTKPHVIEDEIHEILREISPYSDIMATPRHAWRYVCTRLKNEFHRLTTTDLRDMWATDTRWRCFLYNYSVEDLRNPTVMRVAK